MKIDNDKTLKLKQLCCGDVAQALSVGPITIGLTAMKPIEVHVMEWISCEERMPQEDEWILISDGQKVSWGVHIDNKFVHPDLEYRIIDGVTHWMDLPNPPKEK